MKAEHYNRLLAESQKNFSKVVKSCVSVFAGIDNKQKKNSIDRLKVEVEHFLKILPRDNYPAWLLNLQKSFVSIAYDSDNGIRNYDALLLSLIENANNIFNYKWNDEDEISLDSIYLRCRMESRIPELFSRMVDLINNLIISNELDNDFIKKGLNKLLDLINANNNKSLNGDTFLVDYIRRFIKHLLINCLKEITPFKIIIESLEETNIEIGKEIESTERTTYQNIQGNMELNVLMLPLIECPSTFLIDNKTTGKIEDNG
jgi:hypothetical protein